MDGEETPDALAAADAAALLGVTRQRVHQLVKKGVLPGFYRNSRLFVRADAVRARRRGEPLPTDRLTVRDLAVKLGVTEETVRQYHHRGLLRGGTKDNGYMLTFPPDVLDGFVRPQRGRGRRVPWYRRSSP